MSSRVICYSVSEFSFTYSGVGASRLFAYELNYCRKPVFVDLYSKIRALRKKYLRTNIGNDITNEDREGRFYIGNRKVVYVTSKALKREKYL